MNLLDPAITDLDWQWNGTTYVSSQSSISFRPIAPTWGLGASILVKATWTEGYEYYNFSVAIYSADNAIYYTGPDGNLSTVIDISVLGEIIEIQILQDSYNDVTISTLSMVERAAPVDIFWTNFNKQTETK